MTKTRFCRLLLLAAIFAVPASGTTLMQMSLAKMSEAAPLIVRARCVENAAAWNSGEIWTFTAFAVQQTWKGSAPPQIAVRLLGGSLGTLSSRVSGIPRFRPGEEVVLFLEPTPFGDYSVLAWQQGTFRIQRDSLTGEENVTQDTSAFATFDPVTRRFRVLGIRHRSVAELRSEINAAIQSVRSQLP
jgi:hypothetical protein